MDNWQWNSILADFWFLKTLSLCGFYCLLPIALKSPVAVSDCLNAFSLNPFIQWSSLLPLGRCPKPYLLFCLDTKKEAKKVKTAPVSLEKLSFVRLKSSNLLKFDDTFIKVKGHDMNFNFEQGRFLTAFHAYFSAHRPRSRIKKS
jgi:hypothetical protein